MRQDKQRVLGTLEATGVVAVVRVDDPTALSQLAAALREGGVELTEITMTTPGALDAIEVCVRDHGDDILIGAGTVLDAVTARLAIDAGASFIVGPTLDVEVIEMAHRYGVVVVPGALTPTEIMQAWSAGADVIKLFPGRVATPGYFNDLRGPFPQLRLMPTGNVDLQTTPEYIRAGAFAVGVGKALVDATALRDHDWSAISQRARSFRSAVDDARPSD